MTVDCEHGWGDCYVCSPDADHTRKPCERDGGAVSAREPEWPGRMLTIAVVMVAIGAWLSFAALGWPL